jgi:hypothetical protein
MATASHAAGLGERPLGAIATPILNATERTLSRRHENEVVTLGSESAPATLGRVGVQQHGRMPNGGGMIQHGLLNLRRRFSIASSRGDDQTPTEATVLEAKLTETVEQLKQALRRTCLRKLGDESGLVIRERTITADRLVLSLIKSMGSRNVESIADLARDFNFDHGLGVHYKPYYNRLNTPCFARMMRGVFESMLNHLCLPVLAPLRNGPFADFEDITIQDGTSFALPDGLAEAFKGRFTTISPAAVELHCTMSVFSDNLESVAITSDAECERHYLPEPHELAGKLLLGDRGYDSTVYMDQVIKADASVLTRIRKTHNPTVVRIRRRGARYRKQEGRSLRDVLGHMPKHKVLDMDVAFDDRSEEGRRFRLVICWNPGRKEWIRLLTNLDRDRFTADDILQAYRIRWQIELLFKELKSYANLHKFCTTKAPIAEGLMWASLCAAFLKRYLAHACQHVTGAAISTRRVAMCGHHLLDTLCSSLLGGFRNITRILRDAFRFLAHNAKRTNRRREKTRGRLALGLRLAGAKA